MTQYYDLALFDLDNCHTVMSDSSVSDVVSDTGRFAPIDPQGSPGSTEVVDREVVKSPEFDPQGLPASTEVVDSEVVKSPEFDTAVMPSDMSTAMSQFSPLNPRVSPISTKIVDRVVVESPVSDVAPVVDSDMLSVTDQCVPLNPQGSQESLLSSVQLSPDRVRLDFDLDAVDFVPCFVPRSGVYLPLQRGEVRLLTSCNVTLELCLL